MFLSKRHPHGFYYLFFSDDLGKRRGLSTRCKLKSDALKFLQNFREADHQRKLNLFRVSLPLIFAILTITLQYGSFRHTHVCSGSKQESASCPPLSVEVRIEPQSRLDTQQSAGGNMRPSTGIFAYVLFSSLLFCTGRLLGNGYANRFRPAITSPRCALSTLIPAGFSAPTSTKPPTGGRRGPLRTPQSEFVRLSRLLAQAMHSTQTHTAGTAYAARQTEVATGKPWILFRSTTLTFILLMQKMDLQLAGLGVASVSLQCKRQQMVERHGQPFGLDPRAVNSRAYPSLVRCWDGR
jgi:hypothetical protein